MTLRIVARHGDAYNLFGSPKTVARKLAKLKEHCAAVGKNYGEVLKTTLSSVIIAEGEQEARSLVEARLGPNAIESEEQAIFGTPEVVTMKIRWFLEAGIDYMIFNLQAGKEEPMLKLLAEEVLPHFS